MQRLLIAFCLLTFSLAATAQDKLVGRWEGKMQSLQGERETVVIFKKVGESYVGRSAGIRPGTEMQIKDIAITGEEVTAKAEVETPQAMLLINYKFKLVMRRTSLL